MLGSLRLALAVLVVLFHAGWQPAGLSVGVFAVVVFYLISGYAMAGLAGRFLDAPADGFGAGVARFWRDRWLRLYPQYLLWALVGVFVAVGLGRRWLAQEGTLDAASVAANLTVVPLCVYMYSSAVSHLMWLPQGWSLGTELCFYAVFPFTWRYRPLAWLAALGGCAVLALAMAGVLNPDWYGYRLLPGTLPFFMLGRAMLMKDRAMAATLALLLLCLAAFVIATGRLHLGYNREILLAACLGPVLVAAVVRAPAWHYDPVLGHASYGTYLAHIAMLSLLPTDGTLAMRGACAVVLSVASGWLGWMLVDQPVLHWRRRLRG